jgi:hypothetical protein
MIEASCHCGAVRFEIAAAPTSVTDCNCSICRKKGVLWAYYPKDQVRIISADGATSTYRWNDEVIDFHTCRTCGCTTHYSPVDVRENRIAVNARLMEPAALAAAQIKKFDGAAMPIRQRS